MTISGRGFAGATVVSFGGVPSSSFVVSSGRQGTVVDVIAPPHAVGVVAVKVATPAGMSAASTAADFTYQPVRGHWTSLPARPRLSHTATLLPDGKVLVAGGCTEPEPTGACTKATATADLYDPDLRSWSATASMTRPRIGQLATLLPDGDVLVAGGCSESPCSSQQDAAAARTAELYHPKTRTWTSTGSMPSSLGRDDATIIGLPVRPPRVCGANCGKVLVVGSRSATELYDPSRGAWAPTAAPENTRSFPAAVVLHGGKVLVAGSVQAEGVGASPAELYDPSTAMWTATGNAEPSPQLGETATLVPDGRVLAVTAQFPEGPSKGDELYDPTALPDPANPSVKGGAWTIATPALTGRRFGNTATLLRDGTVLIVGGNDADGGFRPLATAELYNARTTRWDAAATMAGGRGLDSLHQVGRPAFTATLLNNGTVLVVGGSFKPAVSESGAKPNAVSAPGPSAELYTPGHVGSSGSSSVVVAAAVLIAAAVAVAVAVTVVARRRRRPPAA